MINCNIVFTTKEKQSDFSERFVSSLNEEEVNFCLNFMKRDYSKLEDTYRDKILKRSAEYFKLPGVIKI